MNEKVRPLEKVLELSVLGAALLVIPVVLIERHATSPSWLTAAYRANWAIWLVFVVEFVVMCSLARSRWRYAKKAWLDLVIIVTSFPALPALFASTRLLRLARLTRVFRLFRLGRLPAILSRGAIALRRLFYRRGLAYVAGLTVFLTLAFGCLLVLAEPEVTSVADGLWWAVATVTTVGYGDVYPKTPEGRILGGLLMLLGLGFVATLTGALAAHFVDDDEDEVVLELRRMNERLSRLEAILEKKGTGTESG